MATMNSNHSNLPRCGLPKRLAVIFYDSLLLLAVLFVATALVMPLTGDLAARSAYQPLFTLYLLLLGYLFFGWFWTHGGQTPGMRAWRVRINSEDGKSVSWNQAFLRYFAAIVSWIPLGAGFLWSLFNKENAAWHDRFSHTFLVVVPKR